MLRNWIARGLYALLALTGVLLACGLVGLTLAACGGHDAATALAVIAAVTLTCWLGVLVALVVLLAIRAVQDHDPPANSDDRT